MANSAETFNTEFREDTGKTLLARIVNPSGTLATQATITSIRRTVRYQDGVASSTTISTTSVYDTIQGSSFSDLRWTVDATGFNFIDEVPASLLSSPGHVSVGYLFDPTSGEDYAIEWQGPVLPRTST